MVSFFLLIFCCVLVLFWSLCGMEPFKSEHWIKTILRALSRKDHLEFRTSKCNQTVFQFWYREFSQIQILDEEYLCLGKCSDFKTNSEIFEFEIWIFEWPFSILSCCFYCLPWWWPGRKNATLWSVALTRARAQHLLCKRLLHLQLATLLWHGSKEGLLMKQGPIHPLCSESCSLWWICVQTRVWSCLPSSSILPETSVFFLPLAMGLCAMIRICREGVEDPIRLPLC